MGAILATIFTVIVVAISSIAIVNPNINLDPRSKAVECANDCDSDSDCGSGYYCYRRSEGCTQCKVKPTSSPSPTTTPTGGCTSGSCYYGYTACSSVGRKSGSGTCGGGVCCGEKVTNKCTKGASYCVDSNTVAVCKVDKSGYKETDCASGTQCDSILKKCVTIKCTNPAGTPGVTQICNTAGGYNYCSTNGKWYSKKCDTGTTCVSGKCVIPAPTTTPKPTLTPSPTSGTSCAATNTSCSDTKPCCNSSNVCTTLPGGKFCVAKGDCKLGDVKCVKEGLTSFVYKCDSSGYYQKDKACDFGCSGTSCKKACTPGAKRCNGNSLDTCTADGSAWKGQSCTNGCQTISGVSSCKAASIPTKVLSPTTQPKPTEPTVSPSDDIFREKTICQRDGGTWANGECVLPYVPPLKTTPTPTKIVLPEKGILDNYKNSSDSGIFASMSNDMADIIYVCQNSGNISGINLKNCFCKSVDCTTPSGEAISDKLSTVSNDYNGLQCVEFVNAMEIIMKNGTTSNCSDDGAQTGAEMALCDEPGYNKCQSGNNLKFNNGDVVVWANDKEGGKEGHVAICVSVSDDGKKCTIAESNWNGDQKVGFRTISTTGTSGQNNFDVVLRRSGSNKGCSDL